MAEVKPVRIDKYLWAVRIFKTRTIASDACRKGRVLIKTQPVKPSRFITQNEIISIKKPPVIFTYQVLMPIEKRVSAKLVPGYIRDLTTDDERFKLLTKDSDGIWYREKGSGRPTKKERRDIDRLRENLYRH